MSDELLRRALSYQRFSAAPRILALSSGYHVMGDALAAARDLDWQVCTLPAPIGERSEDRFISDLLLSLCRHRPDFVLSVNHLGFDRDGVLAGLLHHYQIPLASWFVDHPLPILGGAARNVNFSTQIFCVERTALPWLATQGFKEPVHLPTAASEACDAARIDRAKAQALGAPLCFVGDSWWRKGFGEPAPLVQAAKELRARQTLDRAFVASGLLAEPLAGEQARVVQVALAQAACLARQALATALLPLGLRVHGDPHWAALVPTIDLRPFVDPASEAPAVFAGSTVNVNATAPHLPSGANQRVWDVPFAGGLLLTDEREDVLCHFREDEEVLVYRSLGEAVDKARYFQRHPQRGAEIGARARARVAHDHRYTHRMTKLYQTMRARFA